MHQALYRKWRPRTFDDVRGQDPIVNVLRYEVLQGKPSHAYLFCGSRGTGKTTCAKILAKAVNCEHPENGNPCGKCGSCLSIDGGFSTDVVEMDAASNTGVEYIRDIREEVAYSPASAKYRVYIIDEVHMLSISAFNALLKTLEEPPENVIFILATTELQKVPVTVVSRCQRFDFRRIASQVICERLAYVAKEEGIALTGGAAALIARLAQGGMRDALSMLDLCSGESSGRTVTEESVNDAVGVVGREGVIEAVNAILSRDGGAVFALVEKLYLSSLDLSTFFGDLLGFYRDMLVSKVMKDYRSYLDLTETEAAEVVRLAAGFTPERLLSQIRSIENALFRLQKPDASRRVIAETELLRLCDRHLDNSTDGLLARIAELERKVNSLSLAPADGRTSPPAEEETPVKETVCSVGPVEKEKDAVKETGKGPERPSSSPPPPAKEKTAFAAGSGGDGQSEEFGEWQDVARLFSERDVQTGPLLSGCTARIDRGSGRLTVFCANAFVKDMVDKPHIREQIALLAGSVTGEVFSPGKVSFACKEGGSGEISLLDEL